MKKGLIVLAVLLILISGCAKVEQSETPTEQIEEPKIEIFCPDYDGNQEECLSYEECKWDSKMNECNSVDMQEGEDENLEEDEENEFASDLEKDLPDTVQNQICKKLPLSNELSPADRYYCFAVVNSDPEFCELIKAAGNTFF